MNSNNNPWKAAGLVSVIGIELSIYLLGGIWLGKKVDLYFNTTPVFMIFGMLLGLGLGIWSIWIMLKVFLKD